MEEGRARVGAEIGGRFLLQERLGAGTYGTVWKALDREGGRAVALKLLNAERRGHALSIERFRREAEILERLDHPRIVRAFAWAIEADVAWLAMELVGGEALSVVLGDHASRSAPLSGSDVVEIISGIAEAVAHAHAHGVVHRDLKPRNVMVTRGPPWRVTVLDFGVAKLVDTPKGDATTVGRLLGSLLFMSPEQLGAGDVDGRTDVFALATMAFELLTLRRPWALDFEGTPLVARDAPVGRDRVNNHASILGRINGGPRPSVGPWVAEHAAAIDRVLAAAWAPRAADRTADVRTFAAELAVALEVAPAQPTVALMTTRDLGVVRELGATDGVSTPSIARPVTRIGRLMDGIVVAPDRLGRTLATLGLVAVAIGLGWLAARLSLAVGVEEEERPAVVEGSATAGPPAVGVLQAPLGANEARVGASEPRAIEAPRSAAEPRASAPSAPTAAPNLGAARPARSAEPRRGRAADAAPAAQAAPAALVPPLLAAARARVAAAIERPDGPAIADAAEAIRRAAASISDATARRRVERLAEGARFTAQLDALDAAHRALEGALSPRETVTPP